MKDYLLHNSNNNSSNNSNNNNRFNKIINNWILRNIDLRIINNLQINRCVLSNRKETNKNTVMIMIMKVKVENIIYNKT